MTKAATAHLAGLLDLPQLQPNKVVRFVIEDGGVQMKADEVRPGDIAFKHEDRNILVFDESVAQTLKELKLDLEEESGSYRLVVTSKSD